MLKQRNNGHIRFVSIAERLSKQSELLTALEQKQSFLG